MRNAKALLLFLLVIAFIPYLYTCFYALPFADDFCFGWTASAKIPFLQKFLNQYLHWNGRYASDVLVNLHPLTTGSLLLYQLAAFASIIATPLVFFIFVKQLVDDVVESLITALFISLFYLCYLPNIAEGVYWYIGLVNYHWGSLLFVLQLAVIYRLLKADRGGPLLTVLSLLLLALAIGFNEIGAAIIPAYYMAMLIYSKANKKAGSATNRTLAVHFAFAVLASAFVICSPGNFTRQNAFPERFNLIHSFLFAGLQTGRFVARWAVSVPFIALSLVVVVNAYKVKNETIKNVHAGIWLSLLLFTVFMAAVLPYLATGILGQHRTMNYVLPFFIMLWIAFLLSLSKHYGINDEPTPETRGGRVLVLAIVALAVMFFSGNARKIWTDLASGAFPQYQFEFMHRQSAILQQPNAPIPPLKTISNTFQIVDAKNDTTWWVDKCMKKYYTETGLTLH